MKRFYQSIPTLLICAMIIGFPWWAIREYMGKNSFNVIVDYDRTIEDSIIKGGYSMEIHDPPYSTRDPVEANYTSQRFSTERTGKSHLTIYLVDFDELPIKLAEGWRTLEFREALALMEKYPNFLRQFPRVTDEYRHGRTTDLCVVKNLSDRYTVIFTKIGIMGGRGEIGSAEIGPPYGWMTRLVCRVPITK